MGSLNTLTITEIFVICLLIVSFSLILSDHRSNMESLNTLTITEIFVGPYVRSDTFLALIIVAQTLSVSAC